MGIWGGVCEDFGDIGGAPWGVSGLSWMGSLPWGSPGGLPRGSGVFKGGRVGNGGVPATMSWSR